MGSTVELASSFIEGAPPGEALTSDESDVIPSLAPAFERYNEKQLATVKLPGASQEVIVSEFNKLEGSRYFDVETQTSFEVDHVTQVWWWNEGRVEADWIKASVWCAILCAGIAKCGFDCSKSLLKSLAKHAAEHYPNCSYGVYPTEDDTAVAILLVANRYSPNNFWNGRFRSIYQVPVSESTTVSGKILVDVHYYEDGNVALNTNKPINISIPSISAESIISRIAAAERDYQEELNRAFVQMAEGAFKNLRRQLPITRQKVEWEKVGGYRLGQDISGGKGR
ncbi:LOW QUALITY PROTEIN: F-actin capping protein alpha subunit, putative [Aspergillus udagawae]|uniref:F-actin-capping protein subunit alpha n=1 Tax=Aspergillus udagawae TaxID=91492 RepID=A0A8H3PBA0_9EURO|nr:LOW QUALITY PROTEIN: F-actin capping protein alpha subunit, putative [Aspergillus udagawae]